jgi:hypothetical protein
MNLWYICLFNYYNGRFKPMNELTFPIVYDYLNLYGPICNFGKCLWQIWKLFLNSRIFLEDCRLRVGFR